MILQFDHAHDLPNNRDDEAGHPGERARLVVRRRHAVSLAELALDAHGRLPEVLHDGVRRLLHHNSGRGTSWLGIILG